MLFSLLEGEGLDGSDGGSFSVVKDQISPSVEFPWLSLATIFHLYSVFPFKSVR